MEGLLMSSIFCHNCNLPKEYTDVIENDVTFTRPENCDHYDFKMIRKCINQKIQLTIAINCKICNKNIRKTFEDMEKIYEYNCCGQQKIVFSYTISLKEKSLIKDIDNISKDNKNLINNDINKDDINSDNDFCIINNVGNNNNNLINDNKSEGNSISYNGKCYTKGGDDYDKKIKNNNTNVKIIDVYPWENIAEENKINIMFKYYKKTQVNYKIRCSKKEYLTNVLKEFYKECKIEGKVRYAICDAILLDGEKTIGELKLKENSLILVR